jgi:hypothetical protein
MKTLLLDRQQTLVQWVSQATGISTFGVKVRLLGNDLHILCEGTDCPKRWHTLSDLLQALGQTDLDDLTNEDQSSIYQVLVYGRKKGELRPQWCHRVYLNQLDRHIEQVEQVLLVEAKKSQLTGGALILSNESLARQGNPDAIARYLSENLSNLGVAVQVKSQFHEPKAKALNTEKVANRLWIFCQSGYSPDATLLAEPIAQRLRHLKLAGYEDAVIVSQVRGESEPDWRLRVDLTPPETMLKEWARWGDIQAISRLLNDKLSDLKVTVQVSLKEFTLHIFCTPADGIKSSPAPTKEVCSPLVLSELERIAPQGISAAAIYGQKTDDKQPAWVDWLSLPAAQHPALATPTLALANSGDEQAIIFLLERLLNQDMDWRLRTGGIRTLLLWKGDLLHVMCDAPVCPKRQQVATKVTKFIHQLNIEGLNGVRVYGLRAGDTEPVWHQGLDFGQRQRLVPEATPEFAATSEYVSDLVNHEVAEPVLRPDLTVKDVQSIVTEVSQDWLETIHQQFKNLLVSTQLFTQINPSQEQNPNEQGIWGSLVWVALGFVLMLQGDWMLGYITSQNKLAISQADDTVLSAPSEAALTSEKNSEVNHTTFLSNSQSDQSTNSTFNASSFTQNNSLGANLKAAPLKQKANATAILLAARSQMPSFNARQLDEQLALYKQRLATDGKPPEVLVIGSSRALRGVDPVALSQSLATQGYSKIDVFNFGINGATAQVVEFIICQVLAPAELPKMIIWADGARAFNNGREDITFNAIANSQGYQEVLTQKAKSAKKQSALNSNSETPDQEQPKTPKINGYQAANEWFNQRLSSISSTYQNREEINNLLQALVSNLPFKNSQDQSQLQSPDQENASDYSQGVDFDGFLPLSIRFNPDTYYNNHPKVAGSYDKDYQSFQLTGVQDTALLSVIEYTKAQNISLVFVNMPLTEDYLDPVRKKYEQEFQQYMVKNSTDNNHFIYRDLGQIWLNANDYFSDPSHLNRYGAYEISKKLAVDPMIPWGFQ